MGEEEELTKKAKERAKEVIVPEGLLEEARKTFRERAEKIKRL